MVTSKRKFPVGIQTFSEMIEKDSVYVDKPIEAMTTALSLLYQSGYLTSIDHK